MAEDGADAYAGTAHADAGDAGADHLCGLRIHDKELLSRLEERASVARVDRLTEIDASEDGEDVGLQESDQQFQRREGNREAERHDGAEPTEKAECAQHRHEATEYFERDVTGKHVGEQPYAMGDGPR